VGHYRFVDDGRRSWSSVSPPLFCDLSLLESFIVELEFDSEAGMGLARFTGEVGDIEIFYRCHVKFFDPMCQSANGRQPPVDSAR
jgi:hypothetical protein